MAGLPDIVQLIAEWCAALLEVSGLAIIVLLAFYSLLYGLVLLARGTGGTVTFREARHRLVRSILLGLEFLVAADIIHTVAVELTFTSVGVLAVVVVIRTFLSFTLELENSGRWPWQQRSGE